MKIFVLYWMLSFTISLGWAQTLAPIDVRIQNLYNGAMMNVNNRVEDETESNTYWRLQWSKGIIKFKNGSVVDEFPLRFDLQGQRLEVFLGRETKFLSVDMITEFFIEADDQTMHHFVNPSQYFAQEGLESGFFEVLLEGPWTLLRKSEIKFWEPTYFQTASFEKTIERKEKFYLYFQTDLIYIPPQKKKAINSLKPYIPDIEIQLKAQKINLKQLASLRVLVKDLNQKLEDSTH
ncbi:MAG: hypothetical protein AAF927_12300 [Bacteroidota bacterium]